MRKSICAFILAMFFAASCQLASGSEGLNFTLEDINGDLFTLSNQFQKPAPTLRSRSGDDVGSSTLTNQGPILINFWATWCTPCKHELPFLQKLHEKYADKGLILITISEDSPKSQAKIRPYVRSKKYTFPVLLDPTREVLQLFQGHTLPYRVILDRRGNIIETHQGYNPGDEVLLEEKIRELLNPENADE